MRLYEKTLPMLFTALVVPIVWSATACGDDGTAGVVRISDRTEPASPAVVYRAQSPDDVLSGAACENGDCDSDARRPCKCGMPLCPGPDGFIGRIRIRRCRDGHQGHWCRRNDLKVGNGTYDITYAVNPCYFDRRDGRVYSAAGYGVPMAVPLAPNVGYTYNHGWGVPSSRLTPISLPGYRCP